MAETFELISSITVPSGGVTSIDFTSIPGTYKDLCLKVSSRYDTDVNTYNLYINGANTSQTVKRIAGTGSAVGSSSYNEVQTNPSSATANTFSSGQLYFHNYSSTTLNKTVGIDAVSENNATLAYAVTEAWAWASTSAITSIGLIGRSGAKFVQNSTAYLYGIKNS